MKIIAEAFDRHKQVYEKLYALFLEVLLAGRKIRLKQSTFLDNKDGLLK